MIEPFIIDTHAHIGPAQGFQAHFGATDELVALMDTMRVQVAIVSAMPSLAAQFDLGYRLTADAIANWPGRIRAYTVFDPNWPDVSLRLLRAWQSRPGFIGIKIHPAFHKVVPGDPRYDEMWAFAEERRLVVLTHTWNLDPANPAQNKSIPSGFAEILARHPNLRLILGHSGGLESGRRMAVDLMNAFPNCYGDLAWDTFGQGQLEWLVDEVGEDRLLFGSDANWIEPRYTLANTLKARLPAEIRLKLLRTNALRVFGPALADLATAPTTSTTPLARR